jgi:vesicle coat complex subunit
MGVFVDVLEEFNNRLTTAQSVGKKLETVKEVYVGQRTHIDSTLDMPSLALTLSTGEEVFSGQNRKRASFVVVVSVFDKVNSENDKNLYFDIGAQTGFLFLVERVLDVIMETTAQILDPRFGQNSYKSSDPISFGEIEKLSDGYLQMDISITMHTREFLINERSA